MEAITNISIDPIDHLVKEIFVICSNTVFYAFHKSLSVVVTNIGLVDFFKRDMVYPVKIKLRHMR